MSRNWKVAITVAAVFVALVGAVLASNGADKGQPTARVGRITEMEMSGEMGAVLEQHRQMIEQMQQDASPAMLELMNKDPMWKMMRSPGWAQMDEQHQKDLDRLLGK